MNPQPDYNVEVVQRQGFRNCVSARAPRRHRFIDSGTFRPTVQDVLRIVSTSPDSNSREAATRAQARRRPLHALAPGYPRARRAATPTEPRTAAGYPCPPTGALRPSARLRKDAPHVRSDQRSHGVHAPRHGERLRPARRGIHGRERDRHPERLLQRPAVLALAGDVAGRRILDAGCGSGPLFAELRERGAVISGIDASAGILEVARRRLGDEADLRVADLRDPLPFPDAAFDDVIASLVLHYLEDWGPTLGEFRRVLVPGGRVIVSVDHPFAIHGIHR